MSDAVPNPNVLITLVLKHHAGLTLDEVQAKLKASEWWERFPVEGTRVVSWTVAMGLGLGQIVTLEVPPHLLGRVNLELERSAWGVFATECYPTYDFVPVRERIRERVRAGGQ
ncbi:hypothetical protein ASE11_09540 [Hydrogenophaga sp. Root209]|uniref:hypothetical protein n=1 Tax=Hydrogenophaga sp. Root209 TaxID=1736490 RepID=UPI0006F5DCD8|nr:hypothetical protein [Hydrogenophaga sp. Root209]KRC00539.1 hypothetical protein ASE11_09540 [Hydrogenophaga sp. Root209]